MTANRPFTFIHTADWHIGNPFSRFDRQMRQKLNRAIFRTVELMFMYARNKHIPLLLCAGDAVDNGQTCTREDLLKLFGIIQKYPGLQVVMIAGNHDPLVTHSIYKRVEKDSFPENLHLVIEDEVLDYPEWNLTVFASSAREKNGKYNPLDWIKTKSMNKNMINIGLCHGSIETDAFSPDAFPIPADFAQQSGLDYLALGDWHSFKKINPKTYYPGVPEPLQFGDDGFPLEVTIPGPGQVPRVEPVTSVRQYQWRQEQMEINEHSYEEFRSRLQIVTDKEICKFDVSGFLSIKMYKLYKELLEINRRSNCEIIDHVTIHPGDQELPETADGFMAAIIHRLLELKKSGEQLPIDINPYVALNRDNVQLQAQAISSREIIDRALLKIYSYLKEKD